jgi:hypothetical protein
MIRSSVAAALQEIGDLARKASGIVPVEVTSSTSVERWEVEALRPLLNRMRAVCDDLLDDGRRSYGE